MVCELNGVKIEGFRDLGIEEFRDCWSGAASGS